MPGAEGDVGGSRLGVDRRRRQIRRVSIPVPVERRSGRDRRRGRSATVPPGREVRRRRSGDGWLDRISAVFQHAPPPVSNAVPKVTVCEGVAATLYAAWEPTDSEARGICRRFDGILYRQLGSTSVSPDDDEALLAATSDFHREYRRAYDAIYAVHPEVRGVGQERAGVVVVTICQ